MKKTNQTSQLIHYSVLVRSTKSGEGQYHKWWSPDFPKQLAQKFYDEYLIGNFVIGEEVANDNYYHLQIYIRLRKRKRVHEVLQLLLNMYDWPDPSLVQVQKSPSPRSLSNYCEKDGLFYTEKDFKNSYEKSLIALELNKQQLEINEALYDDTSDRSVILCHDPAGGIGKTTLIKRWMSEQKYDVFLFPQSGSLVSNLYCYAKWYQLKRKAPSQKQILIAINCPRSDNRLIEKNGNIHEFLSSVEAIKDCMFSACFNGKLITINGDPKTIRVVIMTNADINLFCLHLTYDRLRVLVFD